VEARQAKQWLDKELRDRGLFGLVRGEDIPGWYHQIKVAKRKGKPVTTLVEAFRYFQPGLSNVNNAAEAEAFTRNYLDEVRDLNLPRLKLRPVGV
jgi:hypothetical protein